MGVCSFKLWRCPSGIYVASMIDERIYNFWVSCHKKERKKKKHEVISAPGLSHWVPAARDQSTVLALGGIWDVLSDEMVETRLRLNLAAYGKLVDVLWKLAFQIFGAPSGLIVSRRLGFSPVSTSNLSLTKDQSVISPRMVLKLLGKGLSLLIHLYCIGDKGVISLKG